MKIEDKMHLKKKKNLKIKDLTNLKTKWEEKTLTLLIIIVSTRHRYQQKFVSSVVAVLQIETRHRRVSPSRSNQKPAYKILSGTYFKAQSRTKVSSNFILKPNEFKNRHDVVGQYLHYFEGKIKYLSLLPSSTSPLAGSQG